MPWFDFSKYFSSVKYLDIQQVDTSVACFLSSASVSGELCALVTSPLLLSERRREHPVMIVAMATCRITGRFIKLCSFVFAASFQANFSQDLYSLLTYESYQETFTKL